MKACTIVTSSLRWNRHFDRHQLALGLELPMCDFIMNRGCHRKFATESEQFEYIFLFTEQQSLKSFKIS